MLARILSSLKLPVGRLSTSARSTMADAVWRVGYRLAYFVLRLWWFLRRPPHRGAVVAVWCQGSLLVVRQSYRWGLNLPGGSVAKREPVIAAACRELKEELGLSAQPQSLVHVGDAVLRWEYRHDHVSFFDLRLDEMPRLLPDNREIVEARFLSPEAVRALPLSPVLRAYLTEGGVA
jgi:8-oxo-dGTP diphosphatase